MLKLVPLGCESYNCLGSLIFRDVTPSRDPKMSIFNSQFLHLPNSVTF